MESLDREEVSEKLEECFPFFCMYPFYRHFLFPDWSTILDEAGKKVIFDCSFVLSYYIEKKWYSVRHSVHMPKSLYKIYSPLK